MTFTQAAFLICERLLKAISPKRNRKRFKAGSLNGGNGKPKFSLSSDTVRRRREEIAEWDTIAAKSRAFQLSLRK
jgi:hypothetical protein